MAVKVVLTWILGKEQDRVLYKWTKVARDRYRNGIYVIDQKFRKIMEMQDRYVEIH